MIARRNTSAILIGCGKSKRTEASPAASLYTGSLFVKRREYAERSGVPWFIVSAKYGLLHPAQTVAPYDLKISDLKPVDAVAWAIGVARQLFDEFSDNWQRGQTVCELHMGADYAETLRDVLIAVGVNVRWPVRGMSQGGQMAWYAMPEDCRIVR